jgi:hypothetical protein
MKSEELLLQRVRSSFQRIDRIHNATRNNVAPELCYYVTGVALNKQLLAHKVYNRGSRT